jgi:hypothetical protein
VIATVAITFGALLAIGLRNPSSDPLGIAAAQVTASHSGKLLAQMRQRMIQMDAASRTLTIASSPKLATGGASADQASNGGGGGSGGSVINWPAPDPGTAQSIAYDMMSSFGFSTSTQWGCLDSLWEQESGWMYNAENASGAYGIPQALPADKMASAGPNWLTDPATQIKWGLGYIQTTYQTPCGAWAHEEADGWY